MITAYEITFYLQKSNALQDKTDKQTGKIIIEQILVD